MFNTKKTNKRSKKLILWKENTLKIFIRKTKKSDIFRIKLNSVLFPDHGN